MKNYSIRKDKTLVILEFIPMHPQGVHSVKAHVKIDCYHGTIIKEPVTIWDHDNGVRPELLKLQGGLNDRDLSIFIEETLIKEIR
jgi:hypothetical protein